MVRRVRPSANHAPQTSFCSLFFSEWSAMVKTYKLIVVSLRQLICTFTLLAVCPYAHTLTNLKSCFPVISFYCQRCIKEKFCMFKKYPIDLGYKTIYIQNYKHYVPYPKRSCLIEEPGSRATQCNLKSFISESAK